MGYTIERVKLGDEEILAYIYKLNLGKLVLKIF